MPHHTKPRQPHRPLDAPVRTAAELELRWDDLLGPYGYDFESIWVTWFDDHDLQVPHLMPVDEIPPELDPVLVGNLFQVAMTVVDDGRATSIALALTRPGTEAVTETDRARARTLLEAGRSQNVPLRPLHLATDDGVRPLTADDLLG